MTRSSWGWTSHVSETINRSSGSDADVTLEASSQSNSVTLILCNLPQELQRLLSVSDLTRFSLTLEGREPASSTDATSSSFLFSVSNSELPLMATCNPPTPASDI